MTGFAPIRTLRKRTKPISLGQVGHRSSRIRWIMGCCPAPEMTGLPNKRRCTSTVEPRCSELAESMRLWRILLLAPRLGPLSGALRPYRVQLGFDAFANQLADCYLPEPTTGVDVSRLLQITTMEVADRRTPLFARRTRTMTPHLHPTRHRVRLRNVRRSQLSPAVRRRGRYRPCSRSRPRHSHA